MLEHLELPIFRRRAGRCILLTDFLSPIRITSLAKATPGALILGLIVLVALGKCMGEDRPSTPRYATYSPPAPAASTAPAPVELPRPSARPSTPTVAAPSAPSTAPVKSNLTRNLSPTPRKVTAQSLNMRKGPGTGYDRYGDPLPRGTIVMHTGDAQEVDGETWMEVSYQGRLGWVSGRFLGPVDTVGAPPATATDTTRAAPAARPATLFEAPQQEAPVRQTRRAGSGFTCGGKRTCGQMNSCAEANFYLNQCGLYRLDRDGDGYPCESGPC
ncbi:excalibur calcium-binding domain-containing protein [Inquilinus limosus]|uniref:excalibur calcium-binding domain-containing protein n=1 Tax=Inquilinus limosus TaxID=171674 RepID=UPI003CCBD59E